MKYLLDCPLCGKPATDVCQMGIQRHIIGASALYAKCKACGYKVTAQTTGRVTIIRDLWNVRNE